MANPAAPTAAVSDDAELPNFNAFYENSQAKKQRAAVATRLPQIEGGRIVQMEPLLNVPTFLWADDATHPSANVAVPVRLRYSRANIETAARAHLQRFATRYSLNAQDVSAVEVSNLHDTGRGGIIVKFKRAFDGAEVFQEQLTVLMNRQLRLVALSGYVSGEAARQADALKFALPSSKAAAVALSDLTGEAVEATALRTDAVARRAHAGTPYEYHQVAAGAALRAKPVEPLRSKKVFFHLVEGLVPAYYIEANVANGSTEARFYAYVISAVDGALLYRKNLTASDSYSYRVWANQTSYVPADGPQQDYTPHPTGNADNSQPGFATPNLLTLQNFPFSKNDPWLPSGATQTNGNNVDAYVDLGGADGLDGSDFRATVTAPGVFDRTYDVTQDPGVSNDQRMASITQLFYVNNFLHDFFYDHGFDEASGNAQTDNYGRGGLGGDNLRAEAQDTNGVNLNNANMSTPADGDHPRMQMYLWSAPTVTQVTVPSGGIAGTYSAQAATFGPQNFNTSGEVVWGNDGTGLDARDGCESLSGSYAGTIVFMHRGNCNFNVKVKNAQAAGAVGAIISNNVDDGTPAPMGGTDPTVTIPSVGITYAAGELFRGQFNQSLTVNATISSAVEARRDGTIDNLIVAHEWGHYIHHRLTNTGNHQGGSMSEGWGDFTAMLMAVRNGDNFDGVYGLSGYATRSLTGANQYFGLRRYPYSTDMTKNPLTFKHIQTGVPLPTGVPIFLITPDNAEVHNAGELWAVALWECYAALLKDNTRSLTFAERQARMLAYVVAGYKLTPTNATFTEGRDAILAAALANDPVDFQLFAQAFAKRGLGIYAVAPPRYSNDHSGLVENFEVNGALSLASAVLDDSVNNCDADNVLDNGETGKLTVTLRNTGWATLSNTTGTVTSSTPGVSFPNGANLTFAPAAAGATTTASVNVQLAGVSGMQALTFNISFNDTALPSAPSPSSYTVAGNYDDMLNSSATDSVESNTIVWTTANGTGSQVWARVQASNGTNHYWHGPDEGGVSDHYLISPPLLVAGSGNFTLTAQHRYDFEKDATANWDGGVIEYSTDNGANWNDVSMFATPGYTGTIGHSSAPNALKNRSGFTGQSTNYPSLTTLSLNFGSALAGQTVRLRFRIGTDEASGASGWDIDDIAFGGITNTPFGQLVAESGTSNATLVPAAGALTAGAVGTAYSQPFTLSSGSAQSFTLAPGSSLPPGLTLSSSGLLSGLPTTSGNFAFTVQASLGCLVTVSASYTLQINCGVLAISPANLTAGTAGTAYSQPLTVNGAFGNSASLSLLSGSLPSGLTLAPNGVVSGTPTQTGTFNFTVKALDTLGCAGTQAITLTINCQTYTLNPASLPNGQAGVAYSQSLSTSGSLGTVTYSLKSGALPAGLTLSPAGVISGTPTAVGPATFEVKATDGNGCTASKTYSVNIACPSYALAALPAATAGTAYNQTLSVTPNLGAPYSFTQTSGSLPPGLTLSSAGLLSGTPTAAGTFNAQITVSGSGAFASCSNVVNLALVVNCPTLTLPTTLAGGAVGSAYSASVAASPSGGNYSYAVTGNALPAGLSLNPATGEISGTPTAAGTFGFVVTATGWSGCTKAQSYSLTITATCATITLTPASLTSATVGTSYSQSFTASGGTEPYSFAVTAGSLPTGLSLSSAGALTGTPSSAGTFTFTVTATGAGGCTGSKGYSVTVTCPTITISPASLPTATTGTAYNQAVTASPAATYSFSLATGSLPPGLTLNAATGALTGTPTAPGSYSFSVKAERGAGCNATKAYTLVVNCATITVNPTSLPSGSVGAAYSQTLSATPSGSYSFAVSAGSLPGGLTLSTAGMLSGTPTASGTFNFTVRATGFGTCSGTRSYALTIGAACPTITLPNLPTSSPVGASYYGDLSGTTPSGSYTFSVTSGALPPGLALDNLFGALTGTTSTAGTYTFTLKATSANGCNATRAYTVVVGSSAALALWSDFDGDGQADLTNWAATGEWRIRRSRDGQTETAVWGGAGDLSLRGDYDGDGLSDLAIFRPRNGTWYVKRSSDGSALVKVWGQSTDVPVPGDYDGDGKTDIAIWRPSEGHWYVLRSSDDQYEITAWGSGAAVYADVPVPGDFDGDGKTDIAVFRRATGTWYAKLSATGAFLVKQLGSAADVPVVSDYDGDGQTDFAVWRAATGEWLIAASGAEAALRTQSWGAKSDAVAPGDYDGDGKADLAVWRKAEASWHLWLSSQPEASAARIIAHGQADDLPLSVRQP